MRLQESLGCSDSTQILVQVFSLFTNLLLHWGWDYSYQHKEYKILLSFTITAEQKYLVSWIEEKQILSVEIQLR